MEKKDLKVWATMQVY